MTRKKSKGDRCHQTDVTGVMPKLPKQFDTFPFYYASLQCQWMYWYTSVERAKPFVEGTGLCVAEFPDGKGQNKAVILLNFQRYTAHYDNSLGTVNEVEFNLLAYPSNRVPGVPKMTLTEYLHGRDQTKTIGHLRIHVAADNAMAVKAGRQAFGEPKFLGQFNYKVPSLNAKMKGQPPISPKNWWIQLVNPDDPQTIVYDLTADLGQLTGDQWTMTNCTPIPEFATGLGRTVWTRWTISGLFETAMLTNRDGKRVAKSFELKLGKNDFPMTRDMRALFTDKTPVAVQVFESPPACFEPRGFYVDAIDGDRHDHA